MNISSELSVVATKVLEDHLDGLGDTEPANVYRLMINEVERSMLVVMMRYAHGNQSKAAQCMGINRATLRTKLKFHNLL